MRRYRDLSAKEKSQIINYIIDVWNNRKTVIVVFSDRTKRIRLTQTMLRDAIKREFGVEIGYLTLHKIIKEHFQKPEPKFFKPNELE